MRKEEAVHSTFRIPHSTFRICCLLIALAARPAAQNRSLEAISFPTSGSAAAQPHFLRGVIALHNFEYEDANEAFRQAQQVDPRFALAYWGEAMTYNQTLWRHENVAAARAVLARLGSTPAARAATTGLPKEKGLLAAVEILFGEGSAPIRHRRYAQAMQRLSAEYPDDPELASLYALSLLGTMSRSLVGDTNVHEGRSPALAGSDTQRQVATILEDVLRSYPDHPGALHYLLHNYDDPEHARLALAGARRYAQIAPESSHARHMPSHIFLQLGMWRDAAAADRASFSWSNEWIARKGFGPALRNYHALSWLEYELLQLGRYREAESTIGELEPVVKASGHTTLLSNLSSMRARYVVETRRWELMKNARNFGNVDELFAIGMSAARAGNATLAETARRTLAERAQAEQEGDLRPAIAIMEREVAALLKLAAGERDEAVRMLRAAVDAELQLPAPFGLPEPVKPAPELLGEVLVEIGRPRDAIEPFEQALRRNANRSLAILGLARAATALGQTETARQRYRELLANFDGADADLPELKEARAELESANPPLPNQRVGGLAVSLAVAASIAAVAAGVLVVRRKKKSPPPSRGRAGNADRNRRIRSGNGNSTAKSS